MKFEVRAILLTSLLALLPMIGSGSAFAEPERRPQKIQQPPKLAARSRASVSQARKPTAVSAVPGQAVKSPSGWTRIVRATDSDAGAYYSETLALMVDSQYVVVPWTFISDIWLSRPGARLLVEGAKHDAMLAEVDLVANIALLKLAETVTPTFYRSEIRVEAPDQNEPLQVLASREFMRSGARFLRARSDGPFVRYQIAFGSADMAPVRYIFDRFGRLVAVNSGSRETDGWSAPAAAVYELLRRQSGPRPASVSVGDQRRSQLYFWQERWARSLVPTRSALSLQNLECHTHLASIADREIASQVKSVRTLDCDERIGLQVGGGYNAGLRVSKGEAVLRSSEPGILGKLAQVLAGDSFSEFERMSSLVNLLTVPDCRESGVVNRQGLNVTVKFCTSALKFEPGLADTHVVVSALDGPNHASYSIARLRGFDQKNTKMVIESLVENVRGRK